MLNLDWKIVCLEVDEESRQVGRFLESVWHDKVLSLKLRKICLDKNGLVNSFKELMNLEGRIFTVYGSGNYHYFTYGLAKNIADLRSDCYSYIHIDQHTDTSNMFIETPTCANFVNFILTDTNGKTVRYIGAKHVFGDVPQKHVLKNYSMLDDGVDKSLENVMCETVNDIYVSIDLDVLLPNEMKTAYPSGNVDLSTLLQVLNWLKFNKRIISADTLGFSNLPKSEFELYEKEKSLLVYAIIAGSLFGEDITSFKNEHARLMRL